MIFADDYDRLLDQLSDQPWPARQAALPFALAEAWDLPCAYERSVKLSDRSLSANRYLLEFATSDLTLQHVDFACDKLRMPRSVFASIAKRWPRVNRFMIGFEDTGQAVVFKVYVELRRRQLLVAKSHIGWKLALADDAAMQQDAPLRIAFYRPLRCLDLTSQLGVLHHNADPDAPSTVLLREVIQSAHSADAGIICLHVKEYTGRRSHDWNVYPADLCVGDFAQSIKALAERYHIDRSQVSRWLDLCGAKTLGHVAGGSDARGRDFLTLYYAE